MGLLFSSRSIYDGVEAKNMFHIGATELIVIAFVLLLLFGSKKVNELAKGLGESTKEFKKVKNELQKVKSEVEGDINLK